MTFRLNDSKIEELLQIEEEVNCDIGAGADNGPHLGEFLADAVNYINNRKLMALLQDELSSVLSSEHRKYLHLGGLKILFWQLLLDNHQAVKEQFQGTVRDL